MCVLWGCAELDHAGDVVLREVSIDLFALEAYDNGDSSVVNYILCPFWAPRGSRPNRAKPIARNAIPVFTSTTGSSACLEILPI